MKLRLVRLNPLTIDPGGFYLVAARQLDNGRFSQFPARLEYLNDTGEWEEVEFVNEFLTNEDNDAREVRPEVQVPVYNEPTGDKKRGGKPGGGSSQGS